MFASVHALSPTGQCRTFDAAADGIALGEGVACVVLKRLADAERDGDRIYAVIDGVGGSSDGRHLGLTAPRKEGQLRALERAYAQAGRSPAEVGLVEAHGTGTVVGDRTELATLTEVFDAGGAGVGSCVLGSVKSQIGHTKCAAGLAGLIKVARSLHHGVLPPTVNLDLAERGLRRRRPARSCSSTRPGRGRADQRRARRERVRVRRHQLPRRAVVATRGDDGPRRRRDRGRPSCSSSAAPTGRRPPNGSRSSRHSWTASSRPTRGATATACATSPRSACAAGAARPGPGRDRRRPTSPTSPTSSWSRGSGTSRRRRRVPRRPGPRRHGPGSGRRSSIPGRAASARACSPTCSSPSRGSAICSCSGAPWADAIFPPTAFTRRRAGRAGRRPHRHPGRAARARHRRSGPDPPRWHRSACAPT